MTKKIIRDLDTGEIFRSLDELYISWYFQELKENKFISKWKYEPKTFELGDGIEKIRRIEYEQLVTKLSEKSHYPMLLGKHEYTPDFMVKFEDIAEWLFFNNYDNVISSTIPFILYKSRIGIIEIKFEKGKFKGSKSKTNISRKWLLDKHGKFCQEIRYKELFTTTFTPERYISKDKGRMNKQIKYFTSNKEIFRSIDDYIRIRKDINKEYFENKNKYLKQ